MKPTLKKNLMTVCMVWAACGVLCLFMYLLVLSPQRQTKRSIAAKLAKRQSAYEETLQISRPHSREQLEQELAALRHKVEDFAIDSPDSANLTFAISEVAKANDLTSFSIRGSDSNPTGNNAEGEMIGESHIAVSFTGSFQQFARFLNSMERNRPVLFVDSFSIEKGDPHEPGNRINMDVVAFVIK